MPGPEAVPISAEENRGLENFIARLLTTGVIISTSLVIGGLGLFLVRSGNEPVAARLNAAPHDWSALAAGPPSFMVIALGLAVLVATPVLRVFLSIFLFARRADYLYVGITALVFMILLLAIFVA